MHKEIRKAAPALGEIALPKMSDPAVKQAIRLLKAKGITLKQIEAVYRYYEQPGVTYETEKEEG